MKKLFLMILPLMALNNIRGNEIHTSEMFRSLVQAALQQELEAVRDCYVTKELLHERIHDMLAMIDMLDAKFNNLNQQITVLNNKINVLADQ